MTQLSSKDYKSHSLELYFKDIINCEPLSPAEEIELSKKVKEGDTEALNKLIVANLKFVVSVASKYRIPGIALEDLINEGNIGLIKAAHRFDETRGFKFISYAVWWIRQSILQFISEQGRTVRLPANIARGVSQMKKQSIELEQMYERQPTIEELADVMEISEKEALNFVKFNIKKISVDQQVGRDDMTPLRDIIISEDQRPEAQMMKESLISEVIRALKTIPEREAEILRMYFGIGQDRSLTLEEIGNSVNLTRERVRQLKKRAIQRLQHAARAHFLRAFLG
ncbi:MAG: sigma-70 family RNA polymerase sigma factor [Candidatus Marinimicrobia bacterium]|nr:sigma-70 family RNA polymerase sigma factor [Candidatus Neomarinimicrobiota bacterium]MBL7046626.1 sigma-70 family RNA polymerase sigma factor [Candidatus Neomarinimicrobiota bacterium]